MNINITIQNIMKRILLFCITSVVLGTSVLTTFAAEYTTYIKSLSLGNNTIEICLTEFSSTHSAINSASVWSKDKFIGKVILSDVSGCKEQKITGISYPVTVVFSSVVEISFSTLADELKKNNTLFKATINEQGPTAIVEEVVGTSQLHSSALSGATSSARDVNTCDPNNPNSLACRAQASKIGGLTTETLDPCDLNLTPNCNSTDSSSLLKMIINLLNTVFFLLGFVAIALIIFEGILLITTNSSDRRKKIVDTITNIAIGFGTIVLSFSIVNFIVYVVQPYSDPGQNPQLSQYYASTNYDKAKVTYNVTIGNKTTSYSAGESITLDGKASDVKVTYNDRNKKDATILDIVHKLKVADKENKESIEFSVGENQKVVVLDTITLTGPNNTSYSVGSNALTFINGKATEVIEPTTSNGGAGTAGSSSSSTATSSTPKIQSAYKSTDSTYNVSVKIGGNSRSMGNYVTDSTVLIPQGQDAEVTIQVNDANYVKTFSDASDIEHMLSSEGTSVKETITRSTAGSKSFTLTIPAGQTKVLLDTVSSINGSNKNVLKTHRLFISNGALPASQVTMQSQDKAYSMVIDGIFSTFDGQGQTRVQTQRILPLDMLYIPQIEKNTTSLTVQGKLYGSTKPTLFRVQTLGADQKILETKEVRKDALKQSTNMADQAAGSTPLLTGDVQVNFATAGTYSVKMEWIEETTNTVLLSTVHPTIVYGDKTHLQVTPSAAKLGTIFTMTTRPAFTTDTLLTKKVIEIIPLDAEGKRLSVEHTKELRAKDGDAYSYAFLKAGYYIVKLSATYQGIPTPTVVEEKVLVSPLSPVLDFTPTVDPAIPGRYVLAVENRYTDPSTLQMSVTPTGARLTSGEGNTVYFDADVSGVYKVSMSARSTYGQVETVTKTIGVERLMTYNLDFLNAQKEALEPSSALIFKTGETFYVSVQSRAVEKVTMSLVGSTSSLGTSTPVTAEDGSQKLTKDFKFMKPGMFILKLALYEKGKSIPVEVTRTIMIKDDTKPAAAFVIKEQGATGAKALSPVAGLCKTSAGVVEGYRVQKNKEYLFDGSVSFKTNGLPVDSTTTYTWNMDGDTNYSNQATQTVVFKNFSTQEGACQKVLLSVVDGAVASSFAAFVSVDNALPTYSSFYVEKPAGILTAPQVVKGIFTNLVDPDRSDLPKIRWFVLVQGKEILTEVSQDIASRTLTIPPYGISGQILSYQVGAEVMDLDMQAKTTGRKSFTVLSEAFYIKTPEVAEPTVRIATPRGVDGGTVVPWVIKKAVTFGAQAIMKNGDPLSSKAQYAWKIEKTTTPLNGCTSAGSFNTVTKNDVGASFPYTFSECGVYSVSVTVEDSGRSANDTITLQVKQEASSLSSAEQIVVATNGAGAATTGSSSLLSTLPYTSFTYTANGKQTTAQGYIPGTVPNAQASQLASLIAGGGSTENLGTASVTQITGATLSTTSPQSALPAYSTAVDGSLKAAANNEEDVEEIKKMLAALANGTTYAAAPGKSVSGYGIVTDSALLGCQQKVLVLNDAGEKRLACNDHGLYTTSPVSLQSYLTRINSAFYKTLEDDFTAFSQAGTTTQKADILKAILTKIQSSDLTAREKQDATTLMGYIAITPVDKEAEKQVLGESVKNVKAALTNALTDAQNTGNTMLSNYYNDLATLKNSTIPVDIKVSKQQEMVDKIMQSTVVPEATKKNIESELDGSTAALIEQTKTIIRNTTSLSEQEQKDLIARLESLAKSYEGESAATRSKKIQEGILGLLQQESISEDVKVLLAKEIENSIGNTSDRIAQRLGSTFSALEGGSSNVLANARSAFAEYSVFVRTLTTLKEISSAIESAKWMTLAQKQTLYKGMYTPMNSFIQKMKQEIEKSAVTVPADKTTIQGHTDALLGAGEWTILLPKFAMQMQSWITGDILTQDGNLFRMLSEEMSIQAHTALRTVRSAAGDISVTSAEDLASKAAFIKRVDESRQRIFMDSQMLSYTVGVAKNLGSIPGITERITEVRIFGTQTLQKEVTQVESMLGALTEAAVFASHQNTYTKTIKTLSATSESFEKAIAALQTFLEVLLKQDARYTLVKAKMGAYSEWYVRSLEKELIRISKDANVSSYDAEKKYISSVLEKIQKGDMTVEQAAKELDALKKYILASEKIPLPVKMEMMNAIESDPTFKSYFAALKQCTSVYVKNEKGALVRVCTEEAKTNTQLKSVAPEEVFATMNKGVATFLTSIDDIGDVELKKAFEIILKKLAEDTTLTQEERYHNVRLLLSLLEHPSLTAAKRAEVLKNLYDIPVIGDEIKVVQEEDLAIQADGHSAAPREVDQKLKDILAASRALSTVQRSVLREMLLVIKNFYGKNPERVDTATTVATVVITESELPSEQKKSIVELIGTLGRTGVSVDYSLLRPEISFDKLSKDMQAHSAKSYYKPMQALLVSIAEHMEKKDYGAIIGSSTALIERITKESAMTEGERTPLLLNAEVVKDFYQYTQTKAQTQGEPDITQPVEETPTPVSTDDTSSETSGGGIMGFLWLLGEVIVGIIAFIILVGGGLYVSFLLYQARHPEEHVDFEEYILNVRESIAQFFEKFKRQKIEDDPYAVAAAEEELPRMPHDELPAEEEETKPEESPVTVVESTADTVEEVHNEEPMPEEHAETPAWLQMDATSPTQEEPAQETTEVMPPSMPTQGFDPFAAPTTGAPLFNPFEEAPSPMMENMQPSAMPQSPQTIQNTAPGNAPVPPQANQPIPPRPTTQRPYIPRNLQTAQDQVQSPRRMPPRRPNGPTSS